jgi:hypothetical protein
VTDFEKAAPGAAQYGISREEEYGQVVFAVRKLISPNLDPKAVAAFRKKRAQRQAAPVPASAPSP